MRPSASRTIDRNLTTAERAARAARPAPGGRGSGGRRRARSPAAMRRAAARGGPSRRAAAEHVDEPLGGQGEGASGPDSERQDRRPVEILDVRRWRSTAAGIVERAGGRSCPPPRTVVGDRLDRVPVLGTEADRDLVDDALVEDREEVLDGAQQRPARRQVVGLVAEEADHVEPELGVVLQLRRELQDHARRSRGPARSDG